MITRNLQNISAVFICGDLGENSHVKQTFVYEKNRFIAELTGAEAWAKIINLEADQLKLRR